MLEKVEEARGSDLEVYTNPEDAGEIWFRASVREPGWFSKSGRMKITATSHGWKRLPCLPGFKYYVSVGRDLEDGDR